ncbi:MAG: glycosyltransferase family protein [Ignavibacteria bacterium]|nr:glycosyltransferase family protein [Ignavibacteria bacterium]
MNRKKITAAIEARMGSSRLPGKVLMEIDSKPVLQILIERLSGSKYIDEVIVAATTNPSDDKIEELCKNLNVNIYRGSEDDVLGRVVSAVESVKGDLIVEITGDCPLMDPEVADAVIEEYVSNYPEYDYVTNIGYIKNAVREIPLGMDVRVFSFKDLKQISELTDDKEDREHVSLYFFRTGKDKYKLHNVAIPDKWKRDYKPRLCLDTSEDFEVIKIIHESLVKEKSDFNLEDILNFLDKNIHVLEINSEVVQKTVTNLE